MQRERLFHISEEGGIEEFEPRISDTGSYEINEPVVWAIGERLIHNYLLPRDCPRVTFYANQETTDEDREKFFFGTSAKHVIAIESAWLERIRNFTLYEYEFAAENFECCDEIAAYYVSRGAEKPIGCRVINDVLADLARRDVELRIMSSLWKLRDAVVNSSLGFSIIRFRNVGK